MTTAKTRICVTETIMHYIDVDPEDAEIYTGTGADTTDLAEALQRWKRIAHHGSSHIDGWIEAEIEEHPSNWVEPIDGINGKPSYLWSARHFVGRAIYELASGRYHEGNCRELDEVRAELYKFEDRLRVMALTAEGKEAFI